MPLLKYICACCNDMHFSFLQANVTISQSTLKNKTSASSPIKTPQETIFRGNF